MVNMWTNFMTTGYGDRSEYFGSEHMRHIRSTIQGCLRVCYCFRHFYIVEACFTSLRTVRELNWGYTKIVHYLHYSNTQLHTYAVVWSVSYTHLTLPTIYSV